jgi:PAS domain S-box-containing protein
MRRAGDGPPSGGEETTTVPLGSASAAPTAAEPPRARNGSLLTYTQDLYGRFTSVGSAVQRVLGYTPEEALQVTLSELALDEDVALLQRMLRLMFAGRNPPPFALRVRRKDGALVTLEVTTWLLAEQGQPVGLRGMARTVDMDAGAPAATAASARGDEGVPHRRDETVPTAAARAAAGTAR